MSKNKLQHFIAFYIEASLNASSDEEDIRLINEELRETGIDAEASEQEALKLIKKAKAEVKVEKGKQFKKDFYALNDDILSLLNQVNDGDPGLAMAFRKLEDSGKADADEILDDQRKMKLLERLTRREED